jgi:hypothetical protein
MKYSGFKKFLQSDTVFISAQKEMKTSDMLENFSSKLLRILRQVTMLLFPTREL